MTSVANQKGMFAYFRSTSANYTLTVRTKDGTGSGWAAADHPDWKQIDAAAVAKRAIEKARASRNPQKVEPGRYTVILEAQGVGRSRAARRQLHGRAHVGRRQIAFCETGGGNKIGEKIVDNRVTRLGSGGFGHCSRSRLMAKDFRSRDKCGLRTALPKQLYYSRFWAKKQGKQIHRVRRAR